MSGGSNKINAVFYANTYHPIQAGSIDGTDIVPHDNAVYRALLCSNAGLYDPFGYPKLMGDPYNTVFVGRLSHLTNEDALCKAMSKYGRVKNLRLVRHIVTGASCGYAFVEYETEREMHRAYELAHHTMLDDSEIIVDYNRQQLMPGWIPRRLGGGLGGKKESGQLRFGGRDRPFRAPLRQIPYEELKRLGITPPPEGSYMSRFQVPSPPGRKRSSMDRDDSFHEHTHRHQKRSTTRDHSPDGGSPMNNEDHKPSEHLHRHTARSSSRDHRSDKRSSVDRDEEHTHKRGKHRDRSRSSTERSYIDRNKRRRKDHKHGKSSHRDER